MLYLRCGPASLLGYSQGKRDENAFVGAPTVSGKVVLIPLGRGLPSAARMLAGMVVLPGSVHAAPAVSAMIGDRSFQADGLVVAPNGETLITI
jgi:hypothetical protein